MHFSIKHALKCRSTRILCVKYAQVCVRLTTRPGHGFWTEPNGHIESFHNTLSATMSARTTLRASRTPRRTWPGPSRTTTPAGSTRRSGGCRPTSSSGSGKGTMRRGRGRHDDGGDRAPDPPPPQIDLKIVLNLGGPDHAQATVQRRRRACGNGCALHIHLARAGPHGIAQSARGRLQLGLHAMSQA